MTTTIRLEAASATGLGSIHDPLNSEKCGLHLYICLMICNRQNAVLWIAYEQVWLSETMLENNQPVAVYQALQ